MLWATTNNELSNTNIQLSNMSKSEDKHSCIGAVALECHKRLSTLLTFGLGLEPHDHKTVATAPGTLPTFNAETRGKHRA